MATNNDFTSSNLTGRTSLTNGQYLIWGHNAGATNSWSADGIYDRITRTWQVQNTGSVGQVYFQINLDSYPTLPSGQEYKLLVDDDGTLSNGGTTAYTLTNSSGTLYTASVPFPSGTSYFTIGYEAVIPTVSLSASPLSIAENGGVSTITATLNTATTRTVTVNLVYTGTATGSGTDYFGFGEFYFYYSRQYNRNSNCDRSERCLYGKRRNGDSPPTLIQSPMELKTEHSRLQSPLPMMTPPV